MAYITPDTTIYLCAGVPLDNTYQHSIYWTSATTQRSYFAQYATYTLTDYTYQRVNKGVLRCGVKADNIYDVNYMCFQNTAYGSKWFYAFVTSIEYVNDNTTDVFYQIDVLQTWLLDITFKYSWVERQHTATDYIGENIQPEPLKCTEYGYCNEPDAWGLSDLCIIVAVCDVDSAQGVIIDNNYSGCSLYAYTLDTTGASGVNSLIDSYAEKEDAIVSIYLAPEVGIYSSDLNSGSPLTILPQGYNAGIKTYSALTTSDTLGWSNSNQGTYTPANCKMYTYPYTYFSVTDGNGSSLVCPYEYFYTGTPAFGSAMTVTQPVEVICYPQIYRGSGQSVTSSSSLYNVSRYFPEALTLSDFPMCSWNYDAYTSWLAQNSTPILLQMLGSVANIGTNLVGAAYTGRYAGAVSSGVNNFINTAISIASQEYTASIAADVCRGSFSNGGVNAASRAKDFFLGRMSIDAYTAQRYDQFFNMYGYAVNVMQVPTLQTRTYWTYVKTSGCNAEGAIPADAMKEICGLMDAGITWWNGANSSHVLDYSVDNRPSERGVR